MGIPSLGQKASRSSEEEDVARPFHDPDEEEEALFCYSSSSSAQADTGQSRYIRNSVAFRQTGWWRAKRYISTLDGEDNPLINPRGQKMWSVGGEKKGFSLLLPACPIGAKQPDPSHFSDGFLPLPFSPFPWDHIGHVFNIEAWAVSPPPYEYLSSWVN